MPDVLIVGGGQAGLAMGYHLGRRQIPFSIVDAGPEAGHTWRSRWDSLMLFTPSQYDGLPGTPFPAPVDVYPGKDGVASYLRSYAESLASPIRWGRAVTSLTREDDGFVATMGEERFRTRSAVVATGPFQVPFIPGVARDADPALPQIHSAEYRNPDGLPAGPVLVIGGANSGCQIARELAASRPVELAVGRRQPVVPQRILGRDVWWWGEKLGISRASLDSRLGRRLSRRDPIIGEGPRKLARQAGVRLCPRVDAVDGRTVRFSDGTTAEPSAIVWATGFRSDFSWIDVPGVLDERGQPVHRRGVTEAAGLYFLGLTWQWTRGSALLGWVGQDAAFLADRISSRSRT